MAGISDPETAREHIHIMHHDITLPQNRIKDTRPFESLCVDG